MIRVTLPIRYADDFGSGEYDAPRGRRKHQAIDYVCPPRALVHSNIAGTVTKLHFMYEDDPSYRYVEITDDKRRRWRYFYVEAMVQVGQLIYAGEVIGFVQDIQSRYTDKDAGKFMDNHIHLEILQQDGTPLNPENLK